MQIETIGDAVLYCADCMDVLPTLDKVDAVVTDPPYISYEEYDWEVVDLMLLPDAIKNAHGFWFWSQEDFPLVFTTRNIWSKANRSVGSGAEQYEVFYEVNGDSKNGLVYRHAVIDSDMNAQINKDLYFNHPTQKPINLVNKIVKKTKGIVLDPFMGSGTTGVACANLGRKFIGIEIEEKYWTIACERITAAYAQGRLFA